MPLRAEKYLQRALPSHSKCTVAHLFFHHLALTNSEQVKRPSTENLYYDDIKDTLRSNPSQKQFSKNKIEYVNTVEESDKISKVSDMDKMEMEKLFSKTRKRLNDRLKEVGGPLLSGPSAS